MPYPGEHAARLRDPGDFNPDTFRRTKGGTIYGSKKVPTSVGIIWGKLKGASGPSDNPIPQALRFDKTAWTVDAAKKWLKDNSIKYISFEPASEAKEKIMSDIERRIIPNEDVELRVIRDDGKPAKLTGYAAVFNKESLDLGGFVEVIKPNAFASSLKGSDVRALRNHDPNLLLGRNTAGTLRLEENNKGLKFELDLPDTELGRDTAEAVGRGDLSGCSFGFTTKTDSWHEQDSKTVRELVEIEQLYDIGPVTYPAYPDTTLALRSLNQYQNKPVVAETIEDNLKRFEDKLINAEREANEMHERLLGMIIDSHI